MKLTISMKCVVAMAAVFGLLAASSAQNPKGKIVQPDARPMLRLLDLSEQGKKGTPLSCVFMRGDGSQFSSTMTLRTEMAKPGSPPPTANDSPMASIQIDGPKGDFPIGTFQGVVSGPPLMNREYFDLGKSDDMGGMLKLTFAFNASVQAQIIDYTAALINQHEDIAFTTAVGFCYSRDTVVPLVRNAK